MVGLSPVENVWRGWLALGTHDRTRFLAQLREAYRQEREETLAENRRAAGVASPCFQIGKPYAGKHRVRLTGETLPIAIGLTLPLSRPDAGVASFVSVVLRTSSTAIRSGLPLPCERAHPPAHGHQVTRDDLRRVGAGGG